MSYRTWVENTQIFGNNECYQEWLDFIKNSGIDLEDDDGFYEGEITDVMGALTVIENIVENLADDMKERNYNMFDFKDTLTKEDYLSYTDKLMYMFYTGLAFMPFVFLEGVRDKIDSDDSYKDGKHLYCYKLKEGCTIHVSAG